jgi:hypothetical protein
MISKDGRHALITQEDSREYAFFHCMRSDDDAVEMQDEDDGSWERENGLKRLLEGVAHE